MDDSRILQKKVKTGVSNVRGEERHRRLMVGEIQKKNEDDKI
jgi:hypothetical protein